MHKCPIILRYYGSPHIRSINKLVLYSSSTCELTVDVAKKETFVEIYSGIRVVSFCAIRKLFAEKKNHYVNDHILSHEHGAMMLRFYLCHRMERIVRVWKKFDARVLVGDNEQSDSTD
ncbi:hypothetical protein WA026_014246 [Henosepilachna vigintioctopunctata]|uniref:Uncharacterized protein n=1 Tax=Henosepilachna vigintioctopunctata TaxID=420089 RepID=A0AAW1TVE3_9CUCU